MSPQERAARQTRAYTAALEEARIRRDTAAYYVSITNHDPQRQEVWRMRWQEANIDIHTLETAIIVK